MASSGLLHSSLSLSTCIFTLLYLFLDQLNLGNNHGKKAYKFKEISTSACRVICLEQNNSPSIAPVPVPVPFLVPQSVSTSTEGSEDTGEDSYEVGEDTPIEVTYKPRVPQSIVIGGIRPFGPVNFNGFDDFGPDGEPAMGFQGPDNKRH